MRTPRTAWARSSGRSTPPPPRTSTRGWTRSSCRTCGGWLAFPGARRARDLLSVGRPPLQRRRSLPSPAGPLPRNGRRAPHHLPPGRARVRDPRDAPPRRGGRRAPQSTVSAFNSASLDRVLRNMGIECLVVTGVVTDGCVDSTARDGSDLGYDGVLVEDGCAAWSEAWHAAALQAFERYFGLVSATDDIMAGLGPRADAPEPGGSRAQSGWAGPGGFPRRRPEPARHRRSTAVFDVLIRGGTVVSAEHSLRADVAIRGATVAAILAPARPCARPAGHRRRRALRDPGRHRSPRRLQPQLRPRPLPGVPARHHRRRRRGHDDRAPLRDAVRRRDADRGRAARSRRPTARR